MRYQTSSPPPKLFADAMLAALARWLRVLDVDVAYDPALDDPELVERAVAEGRTILTRDRKLTERRLARNHILIRSDNVDEQVRQVLEELGIRPDLGRLLGRCLLCNLPLEAIEAEAARGRVPPYVARTQEEFRACPGCGRIYWRGTHVDRMARRLARMGVSP
ncbi:MAG TPA: Mut7-C RNAse domain-containing protein [Thermoanaerobaculia bacterium]|nr:Mut7-C RNAse domain-containing protein [Thermoanaerobaculia bacterium]